MERVPPTGGRKRPTAAGLISTADQHAAGAGTPQAVLMAKKKNLPSKDDTPKLTRFGGSFGGSFSVALERALPERRSRFIELARKVKELCKLLPKIGRGASLAIEGAQTMAIEIERLRTGGTPMRFDAVYRAPSHVARGFDYSTAADLQMFLDDIDQFYFAVGWQAVSEFSKPVQTIIAAHSVAWFDDWASSLSADADTVLSALGAGTPTSRKRLAAQAALEATLRDARSQSLRRFLVGLITSGAITVTKKINTSQFRQRISRLRDSGLIVKARSTVRIIESPFLEQIKQILGSSGD